MRIKLSATLLLLVLVSNVHALDRGLGNSKSLFIEKGTVSLGITGGYNSWISNGNDGYSLAGIIDDLKGEVSFSEISASGSWFFRDNMSVGIRLGYCHENVALDSLDILNLEFKGKNLVGKTVSGALFYRDFIPLFDSRILAMFIEGRLSGSVGYSKNYELTNQGKEGMYDRIGKAAMGFYSGICVFTTDNISLEVSVPLVEGGCNWKRQENGQEYAGSLTHWFFNLKPSLTGLRIGVAFYF